MKKILLSSFILSGFLFANQLSYIPLNKSNLANENGGDKTAIEAYSDGVGIYTVGKFQIDNRAMNELMFKHGEEARKNGETLKEFVLSKGNNEEKYLAEKLGNLAENILPSDGTLCDDNNPNTENDIYVNGTCQGTLLKSKFELLFENGTSVAGGIIDLEKNQIYGYRVDGTGTVGYNSVTLDNIYNMGIKELNYNVISPTCGTVYFGRVGNLDHFQNIAYHTDSTTNFNLNLETKILTITGNMAPGYPRVIDNSHRDLSELSIGIAAIQASSCWTTWTFY